MRCAEVLPCVPVGTKAVMHFMEKMFVRRTLFRHELSCCGCELNIRESAVYIKQDI